MRTNVGVNTERLDDFKIDGLLNSLSGERNDEGGMNLLRDVLSEPGFVDAVRLDHDLTNLEDETVTWPVAIELLEAIQLPPRDGQSPDSIMNA